MTTSPVAAETSTSLPSASHSPVAEPAPEQEEIYADDNDLLGRLLDP